MKANMQLPQVIGGKKPLQIKGQNSVTWAEFFRSILSYMCAFWCEIDNIGLQQARHTTRIHEALLQTTLLFTLLALVSSKPSRPFPAKP